MRKIITVFVLIIISVNLFAETVYLKDGTVISGKIVNQNEDIVTVETTYGTLSISKSEIDKIDYGVTSNSEAPKGKEIVNNSVFMIRPLATIITGIIGGMDIVFEGQTAFTKSFALNAIGEVGSIGGVLITGMNIGPQYNFASDYLNGPYVGVYPGFFYATDYYYEAFGFTTMLEAGYQGISKNGFSWGAFVGYFIAEIPSFKFGLKIGWAYPDMLVKLYRE